MTVVINGTTGIDTVQDGIITNAKIASMAATKLTGQVPDANAPSGSVIQVVQYSQNIKATVNSAAVKVTETNITTSVANSKLLIILSASIGGVINYQDYDLALALGYKTGSAGSSSTDYTAVHGNPYSRQSINGLGSFFAADTQREGASGGNYWSEEKTYLKVISPNQAASTNIYVSFWAGSDSTYYIGSPSGSNADDAGGEISLTLMEIAP